MFRFAEEAVMTVCSSVQTVPRAKLIINHAINMYGGVEAHLHPTFYEGGQIHSPQERTLPAV